MVIGKEIYEKYNLVNYKVVDHLDMGGGIAIYIFRGMGYMILILLKCFIIQ